MTYENIEMNVKFNQIENLTEINTQEIERLKAALEAEKLKSNRNSLPKTAVNLRVYDTFIEHLKPKRIG